MMPIIQKPLLNLKEVTQLIPQKPPMVMIDKLWVSDEKQTVSGFSVSDDNIFCKEKHLLEPALMENVAQTVAIRAGYMASQESDDAGPSLGYIASIKNCNIYSLPKVSAELRTSIIVERTVMNVSFVKGTIMEGEETILECEMRIYGTQAGS